MPKAEDLREMNFSPADAKVCWDISTGMYNSYQTRGQLPATIFSTGSRSYTRFDVVQLCLLGIQLDLVKNAKLPQLAAKELAAEAAVEIEKEFLKESPGLSHILFAVVVGDKPRWFRVGLDDTVSSIDKRAGGTGTWLIFDASVIVERVCSYVIDQSGKRPEFEKWAKRWKARKN